MKIGLICPYSIAKGGGVQEAVKEIQLELNKRGHEAIIITPQPKEPYTNRTHKVIFLGSGTDFKVPSTTTQLSASVMTDEIDAVLEYERFDVLHFHEPWMPVLSRQILSRSRSANVATFHAKLPETLASRAFAKVITPYTKPLLRHIDAFTAVSDAAAEYVRSLTDAHIELVPNGINLLHFRKPAGVHRDPKQPPTILFVGRLEKRKGVKYLLYAFQLVREHVPTAELLLVGDGVDREKLQEQVLEMGLEGVKFLGYVDNAEKTRLMHTADVFCSPALYGESFGIVLLEAMASGIVTVAGDNPGYESVMTGLGQLSLVDPRDTREFAHRLELLLGDEGLRVLWRNWAKKYVKQFSYAKVVDHYEAVYEQAIAHAKVKAAEREQQ